MHIVRQLPEPPKTNNVFVRLWRWIREKLRRWRLRRRCRYILPNVLLPELRRIEPSLEPKDPDSEAEKKRECIELAEKLAKDPMGMGMAVAEAQMSNGMPAEDALKFGEFVDKEILGLIEHEVKLEIDRRILGAMAEKASKKHVGTT